MSWISYGHMSLQVLDQTNSSITETGLSVQNTAEHKSIIPVSHMKVLADLFFGCYRDKVF